MSLLLYSRKHKTRVWLLSDTVDVASGLVIPLLGVRFFRSLSQKKTRIRSFDPLSRRFPRFVLVLMSKT